MNRTEAAFIGMAMLGRSEVMPSCKLVSAGHLTEPFCQAVYTEIRCAHSQGRWPAEAPIIAKLTERFPKAEALMLECLASIGQADDINQYVQEIMKAARIRKISEGCSRYVNNAVASQDDTVELPTLKTVIREAEDLCVNPEPISCVYEQAMADAQRRVERRTSGGTAGVPTGFKRLDQLTGGWQPGLNVLGGWSSMGKTSVMAAGVIAAITAGARPRIIPVDMGPFPITWRVSSILKRIPLYKFSTGELSEKEMADYAAVMARMEQAGCAIDSKNRKIDAICASLIEYRETYGIVFIDYCQKIGVTGSGHQEKDRIEQVLEKLDSLQEVVGRKPIVLLSQLSDPPKARDLQGEEECPKPNLNQFRGNRYITDFAATGVLVWRSQYGMAEPSATDRGELIVCKNQNGALGSVAVSWDGVYAKYSDRTKDEQRRFDD